MKLAMLVPATFMLLATASCRTDPQRGSVDSAVAETRMAAASDGRTAARPEVTVRRLSAGNDYDGFAASAISPDGRYISFIDWSTHNLAVRDLRTGKVHHLTKNGGENEAAGFQTAYVSVFSRDGRRILYGWQYHGALQLRVKSFQPDEAGAPRTGGSTVILHKPRIWPYAPFDWSPDGSQIVVKVYLLPDGTGNQLALVSTTDGTYRALKTFDWREPTRAAFSPDGRFVAYDFQPDPDTPDRDVFVVSVDGTYEARIARNPASDRLLGWHPDGSILFESDRGGTPGVWRIPMSDGRPAGEVELVRADMWRIQPLGFAEGRFYYGVNAARSRLYTVDIDLATGAPTGRPVVVDEPARIGSVGGWDWSPDGRYLAYAGDSLIVIQSDAGDEVRAFPSDLKGRFRLLRWDPDGKSLIVFADDDKGRGGFQRVDFETGKFTTIVRSNEFPDTPIRGPGYFDVSADGRTLWFVTVDYRSRAGWQFDLVAYDIETRASRRITPAEWVPGTDQVVARVSVSPDGSRLAVVAPDSSGNYRVGTIPVDGGVFTPLAPIEKQYIGGLEWTADGSALVFSTVRTEDWPEGFRMWVVPATGGEVRRIEPVDPGSLEIKRYLRIHPRRARIAFVAGDVGRQEVWVMDGLDRQVLATGSDHQ